MYRRIKARSARVAGLLALLVVSLQLTPRAALAQSQPSVAEDSPTYRQTVQEAVREFEAQHYAEARALFASAHALYPNARTERGLGFTEFELRNYAESIAHLEAALDSSVKPLTDELRGETEQLLSRARAFVGKVTVELKPRGSFLSIDGLRVELQAGKALTLHAGEHVLEAQAPGFVVERRRLSIQGGEEQRVSIALVPQPQAARDPKDRSWYKSPWLWAGVGVVVAGAATATGVVLSRPDSEPAPYGGSANGVLSGP
ncbi:MAG TPA: hypothetical protein VFZ61_34560 [Polyangiales bacterium]